MLHLGPKVFEGGYFPCDFYPESFAKSPVKVHRVDFCTDLGSLPNGVFDVVMHNHVLEHIPCPVIPVMQQLNSLLAPGGVHMFSAAIIPNRETTEDLDPSLSPEERRRRFGQEDHLRLFGSLDFMDFLDQAGMQEGLIALASIVTEREVVQHAIPLEVLSAISAHRVFVWRCPSTAERSVSWIKRWSRNFALPRLRFVRTGKARAARPPRNDPHPGS